MVAGNDDMVAVAQSVGDLPRNALIAARIRRITEPGGESLFRQPALPGQFKQDVPRVAPSRKGMHMASIDQGGPLP